MSEIKINCQYTSLVDVSHLVENPKNANKHTKEQIERLAKIMSFQGWRHPIVVSKRSGFICAGHGRLLAAKLLGLDKVPVDYQEFISEAMEFAFLVADNEIARWAEFDEAKFLEDVKTIDLGDIDLLGMKNFVMDIPKVGAEFDPFAEDVVIEQRKCPHCDGIL
jgi:hypothetical protein